MLLCVFSTVLRRSTFKKLVFEMEMEDYSVYDWRTWTHCSVRPQLYVFPFVFHRTHDMRLPVIASLTSAGGLNSWTLWRIRTCLESSRDCVIGIHWWTQLVNTMTYQDVTRVFPWLCPWHPLMSSTPDHFDVSRRAQNLPISLLLRPWHSSLSSTRDHMP